MSAAAEFPIPLSHYKAIPLDPKNPKLTAEQRETLKKNIDICRDAIVFFTPSRTQRDSAATQAVRSTPFRKL